MLYTAAELRGKRLKLSMLITIQIFILGGLIGDTLHRLLNDAFALSARIGSLILIDVNCILLRLEILVTIRVLGRQLTKDVEASIFLTVVGVEGSFFDHVCCHIVRLVHLLLIILGFAFMNSFIGFFDTDHVHAVTLFECKLIPS